MAVQPSSSSDDSELIMLRQQLREKDALIGKNWQTIEDLMRVQQENNSILKELASQREEMKESLNQIQQQQNSPAPKEKKVRSAVLGIFIAITVGIAIQVMR